MKKHIKLNWQLPFVAFAVVTLLLVGQTEIAAQNQRIFKPGDTVTDGSYVYKILRCKGQGEWDECETQAYLDGKPTGAGGPQWWTIRNLRAIEERYLEAQKRKNNSDGRTENSNNNTARQNPADTTPQPTVSPTSPKTKPPTTSGKIAGADGKWKVGDKLEVESRSVWYPAQIIAINGNKYKIHYDGYPASDDEWVEDYRMRPVGGHQITAECGYDLPGEVSPSAKPSEQLFKKKIWQRYFMLSQAGGNPSVSSPLTTGIAFLTFQMGAAFKNTVGVRPGGGASRINNGAPVNATIYPVKTKYVICKKFKDGVSRSLHDEEMNCFKNKEGEWTCDGSGVPKITQID
jgi:hypothetical protein